MTKQTKFHAADPVVSRKAAIPVQLDRGGGSVFTASVKTLAAITAIAGVVSVFVPVVLGIAVFTGLLAIIGLVMAYITSMKFDNQYEASQPLDGSSVSSDLMNQVMEQADSVGPYYYEHSGR